MVELHTLARMLVFAVVCAALAISLAAWLVRTRRISPFSALARGLRTVSDPVLRPIEHRLVRSGGNPVHAGWWLAVGATIVGIVVLVLLERMSDAVQLLLNAVAAGPRAMLALAVTFAYRVLVIALFVRIIGTWIGAFRYSPWMRPAFALTDWLVEPIRRVLPPLGMFDLSPLAAWFVLLLIRQLLLSII